MEEDSLDRGQRTVHYFFQNGEFAKGRGGGGGVTIFNSENGMEVKEYFSELWQDYI